MNSSNKSKIVPDIVNKLDTTAVVMPVTDKKKFNKGSKNNNKNKGGRRKEVNKQFNAFVRGNKVTWKSNTEAGLVLKTISRIDGTSYELYAFDSIPKLDSGNYDLACLVNGFNCCTGKKFIKFVFYLTSYVEKVPALVRISILHDEQPLNGTSRLIFLDHPKIWTVTLGLTDIEVQKLTLVVQPIHQGGFTGSLLVESRLAFSGGLTESGKTMFA